MNMRGGCLKPCTSERLRSEEAAAALLPSKTINNITKQLI